MLKRYKDTDAPVVFLSPGDIWFGGGHKVVRTLLGSCISITLWNRAHGLGGMCHYLLPEQCDKPHRHLDRPGYYGSQALAYFEREANLLGLSVSSFQAKIFGGGNMFYGIERKAGSVNISARNIEWARQALAQRNVKVVAEDVGGHVHRTLFMEMWSGDVWVRQGDAPKSH
ncbi:chemotaxis protein CheD [Saccharospirillum mangrovi]|uniref:chemotaxis protein CheD n=1 Tax=Saccharospirillum mangrovi TaxID=2161747 RepID=UPI000D355392|nr:chemotaxis protein CheD [Saccharospirillum mangrovi]